MMKHLVWNTETAKTEEVSNNWCEADQEESFGQQSVEYGRRMARSIAHSMADVWRALWHTTYCAHYNTQYGAQYGTQQQHIVEYGAQ